MAKASLVLPDGTKVNIEGTSEEVAVLLAKCSSTAPAASRSADKKGIKKGRSDGGSPPKRAKAKGPVGLLTELAGEGFFKSKRILPEIQKQLEENGHIYFAAKDHSIRSLRIKSNGNPDEIWVHLTNKDDPLPRGRALAC